jgi:hypothetical protein
MGQEGVYKMKIGVLLGGFVAILVGVSLMPVISKTVGFAAANPNVNNTLGAALLLKLIPGFFALGIAAIGIMVAWSSIKNTLSGCDEISNLSQETKLVERAQVRPPTSKPEGNGQDKTPGTYKEDATKFD